MRLGQRIGALLLDRVLRRHDHKQVCQLVTLVTDRDLALLHRFEQSRLDFRRRTIDFVGKNQVVKQRPFAKFESTLLRAINLRTRQVGRQEVGGKLKTLEISLQAVGQHLDCTCFRQPRRPLDQDMAITQQRDQHAVDQMRLADD